MALGILTAVQGRICALIRTDSCMYIPDNSANASKVLEDLHTQIDAMSELKMNSGDLLSFWFTGFTWWKKALIFKTQHLALLLLVPLC
jgi:hypothetical protein